MVVRIRLRSRRRADRRDRVLLDHPSGRGQDIAGRSRQGDRQIDNLGSVVVAVVHPRTEAARQWWGWRTTLRLDAAIVVVAIASDPLRTAMAERPARSILRSARTCVGRPDHPATGRLGRRYCCGDRDPAALSGSDHDRGRDGRRGSIVVRWCTWSGAAVGSVAVDSHGGPLRRQNDVGRSADRARTRMRVNRVERAHLVDACLCRRCRRDDRSTVAVGRDLCRQPRCRKTTWDR